MKMTPVSQGGVSRMSLDKKYSGSLEASAKGEMLAVMTPVQGSAGYVAMEVVEGSLGGRTGSFALQHSGVSDKGVQHLTITVVPDSGTGQLVGIAGSLTIDIVGREHYYGFEYTLPEGR